MRQEFLRFLPKLLVACMAGPLILGGFPVLAADESIRPPAVGEQAPDFALMDLSGAEFKLSSVTGKSPVVLVVLRGYPGYQCPVCSKQVGKLMEAADRFHEANAHVVLVYPGPSAELQARAKEFLGDRKLPQDFHLLIDPDYSFTNKWNLRWDAPKETAYPSTFVIGTDGKIQFAKISRTHGGRANADEVLQVLAK